LGSIINGHLHLYVSFCSFTLGSRLTVIFITFSYDESSTPVCCYSDLAYTVAIGNYSLGSCAVGAIVVCTCSKVFPISPMVLVKIIFVSKFVMISRHCYSVKSCDTTEVSSSKHSLRMVFGLVYRSMIVGSMVSHCLWATHDPHAAPVALPYCMSVITVSLSDVGIYMVSVAQITRPRSYLKWYIELSCWCPPLVAPSGLSLACTQRVSRCIDKGLLYRDPLDLYTVYMRRLTH
jgi:hypothetical protein